MRRKDVGPARAVAALVAAATLIGTAGADARGADTTPKADETIVNLAVPSTAGEIRVEGVGLVIGLRGTGSDPGPSWYREKLLGEMRRDRVEKAEDFLKSPHTSLVLVRAVIPTGVGPRDPFDVEVVLPPESETTSLADGYLMETTLTEVRIAGGNALEGKPLAKAHGWVLTGTVEKPEELKFGRVLGGARVKKSVPFLLLIDEKRQSGRTAKLIEEAVNRRFHQREGIDLNGMAEAKSDKHLELRVPRVYHQNQGRYFQIVKQLPVIDLPTLRAERQARWAKELLDPKTAGMAAIRLEGLGKGAIEAITPALESLHPQVRFFAAEALAYLDDPSGVEVLAKTAIEQPQFRTYALAALAAMEHPAAAIQLRELMNVGDVEVCYGAFNALRALDPNDPFLGRVRVRDDPPPAEGQDSMSMRLASPRPRRRAEEPFDLYLVDSDGPPLVHVARTRRCEIVVFGQGQKLLTPLYLGGAGKIQINAADGDDRAQVSRVEPGRLEVVDQTVSSPLELGAVIRTAANLGATYPEVLDLLQAAGRQKNLPGPLVVDALPPPSIAYDYAQIAGVDVTKKDAAVQQAGLESAEEPRRGLLKRIRGRMGR